MATSYIPVKVARRETQKSAARADDAFELASLMVVPRVTHNFWRALPSHDGFGAPFFGFSFFVV